MMYHYTIWTKSADLKGTRARGKPLADWRAKPGKRKLARGAEVFAGMGYARLKC
jgi:hypothetical protein